MRWRQSVTIEYFQSNMSQINHSKQSSIQLFCVILRQSLTITHAKNIKVQMKHLNKSSVEVF